MTVTKKDLALRQVERDAKSYTAATKRADDWQNLLLEAVRKAQTEGASLREIAKSAGFSHQWVDRLLKTKP